MYEVIVLVCFQVIGLQANVEVVVYFNGFEKVVYINVGLLFELFIGKIYQFWVDVEGEMINMGVL